MISMRRGPQGVLWGDHLHPYTHLTSISTKEQGGVATSPLSVRQ